MNIQSTSDTIPSSSFRTISTKDTVLRARSGDKKAFRDWLKRARKGYEFDIAKFDVATVEKEKWPKVGAMNGNLQCPDGFDEWVEDEHAWGSSRPWSKETTWTERKLFRGRRRNDEEAAWEGLESQLSRPGFRVRTKTGKCFPTTFCHSAL